MQSNEEIILIALSNNLDALKFINNDLQLNREFMLKAIKVNYHAQT